MINGDHEIELTTREARILREELRSHANIILEEVQAIKGAINEHAELTGNLWREVQEIKIDCKDIRGALLPETLVAKAPGFRAKPAPSALRREPPKRMSIPPSVGVSSSKSELVATDTGSFRVPEDVLNQIMTKVNDLEEQKRLDSRVKQTLSERNELLQNRVKFVMALGAGVVGIVTAIAAVVTWGIHHVH
jgi:hypothetical protein